MRGECTAAGTLVPMDAIDELIRAVATDLLRDAPLLSAEVSTAITSRLPVLAGDPAVAQELVVSTRANILRFLRAAGGDADDVAHPSEGGARGGDAEDDAPGGPVPPEALDLARMFVRRGIDLETLANTYRWGQNAAWQVWMRRAVELSPPQSLPELLERSSAAMFGYVDEVLTAMRTRVEAERGQLQTGTAARREQTVRLLLEGAPIDGTDAGRLLGYDLAQHHTAFVVWVDPGTEAGHGDLERVAAAVGRAAGPGRVLIIPPGRTSVWGWTSGEADPVDGALRAAAESAATAPRVAVGGTHRGIEGFRRSHEEAVEAQGLVAGRHGRRFVMHRDVAIVALLAGDRPRLRTFVVETLGPLASEARGAADLAETLRVYFAEGESAARTAARLGTHRNTVLGRLARAEALLGRPLAERRLALAVALEADHHLGTGREATVV